MNIKLKIEYIGTNYSGWQRQDNLKTVQGEIEKSLKKITGEEIEIFASGRTDSGVHAFGQVANFSADTNIPPEKFKYAINQYLPDDIRILESEEVSEEFHSRFSAKKKIYVYRIQTGDVRRPFEENKSYFVNKFISVEKMISQSKFFIGEHDFSAFKSDGSSAKNFVRTIYSIDIFEKGDIIELEICGNGFLYNMVRIIVGTLVEIGKGKAFDVESIIKSGDRQLAGPTAPAHGLFLKEVIY